MNPCRIQFIWKVELVDQIETVLIFFYFSVVKFYLNYVYCGQAAFSLRQRPKVQFWEFQQNATNGF